MDEYNRARVNEYLAENFTDPLDFYNQNWSSEQEKYVYSLVERVPWLKITKKNTIYDAIRKVLEYTGKYASGAEEKIETHQGRLRSVIDIWRHLKKYNPELTIFEVMDSISRGYDGLYSHYCGFIERRVFCIADHDEYDEEINYWDDDEFGLTFDEWENI